MPTTAEIIRAATRLLPPASAVESAPRQLPTAALQQSLALLYDAGSADELYARQPDLKRLIADALDWSHPGASRATKPVVKAIATALLARTDDDQPAYSQAVEMLSYLALWAPLLEPDRLARVAAHANTVRAAYAPIRYGIGPSGQLRLIVSRYDEARREALAISLWQSAHDGRWWMHTTGDHRDRARARTRVGVSQEERRVLATQIQGLLNANRAPSATLLRRAVESRTLNYSHDAADLVRRTRQPNPRITRELVDAVRRCGDGDATVLSALLPWLHPAERPESPVAEMISILITALGGPTDLNPEDLPAKPLDFADLYPLASRELFHLPAPILDFDGARLPGLAGVDLTLMRHADMLKHNGDDMGNCTFRYRQECHDGRLAIIHFAYAGVRYNASFQIAPSGAVSVREVNSRYNRGRVPPEVRTACEILATQITSAVTRGTATHGSP